MCVRVCVRVWLRVWVWLLFACVDVACCGELRALIVLCGCAVFVWCVFDCVLVCGCDCVVML